MSIRVLKLNKQKIAPLYSILEDTVFVLSIDEYVTVLSTYSRDFFYSFKLNIEKKCISFNGDDYSREIKVDDDLINKIIDIFPETEIIYLYPHRIILIQFKKCLPEITEALLIFNINSEWEPYIGLPIELKE